MASQADQDLLIILQHSNLNADVKMKGWEYLLGLTATKDGLQHILQAEIYIPFLLSFIKEDKCDEEQLKFVYDCLINISSSEKGASAMLTVSSDIITILLNSIHEPKSFVESKCYILSNISRHFGMAEKIWDVLSSKELLEKVMSVFCSSDVNVRSRYNFLSLVFANISRLPAQRRLFLKDDAFINGFLLCSSKSEVRRLGAALTLRNCCAETESHKWLLQEKKILPDILLPLMGPEEYDEEEMDQLPLECQYLESSKVRASNPQVRRMLVQTLSLLCYTEEGWNYLKSKGVYYVVRELHKWEKDDDVIEAIETLVTFLLVEQYSIPSHNKTELMESVDIQPLETDVSKDLPDIVI